MKQRHTGPRLLLAALALTGGGALATSCGGAGSGNATSAAGGSADVSPAGDIPDTQAFVTFSSSDGTFSMKVPEGWSRTQTGLTTEFTDKLNSARVEATNEPVAPTVASATAVEVPAIAAASRGFKLGDVSTVKRTGGDAVLITYQVDGSADPVTGKSVRLDVERYEFAKDGRQVTITLSAPVGSDNVDPWKTITDSFGWQG
jgi:hypothetical protein